MLIFVLLFFLSDNNDIEFTFSGNISPFSAKVNNYLFRIIQEALSNAVKHSNADTINLHLIQNNENLILIAEDNGSGFNFYDKSYSMGNGLFNMQERVRLLNGNFDIETSKNTGTTIRIKIPLNNNND